MGWLSNKALLVSYDPPVSFHFQYKSKLLTLNMTIVTPFRLTNGDEAKFKLSRHFRSDGLLNIFPCNLCDCIGYIIIILQHFLK